MAVLQTTEVPVGSAGTPSLGFTGDTNTGIYRPAADQVGVATGGSLRLLVGNATLQYNTNDVAVKNSDGTLTIATGTAGSHAVTLDQLNAVASGYDPKASARVATTGSETFTISGGAVTQISGTSVDGVTCAVNDRILIKNAPASSGAGSSPETTQPANGVYVVTNATTNLTVTRSTDADVSSEVTAGLYLWVTEGTANQDTAWVITTNDTITLNTTAITFAQHAGLASLIAGNALTKTGNTLDVNVDGTGIEVSSDALRLKDDGVTNAKLANMAQATIKGRASGAGTGDPVDLTADQLMTIINTATTDIADARLSSNVPLLNAANSFTAANVIVPVALTDGANIAVNAALSNVFTVTLGGNRTLDNPTNPTHGQTIIIHIKQDATGNRTLAYGSAWAFKGASTISTTANFVDILSATYNSADTKWHATLARQDVTLIDAATLDSLDSTDFLRTNGANTATAAITMDDTTHFWINLSGLTTTGIKWDTTANQIQFQDAGTTRAYIDLDNGELSATSLVETSDVRLKDNIINIDSTKALKQVKKLQGVSFTRKDTGAEEIGLIAQRVKALEPRLVSADANGILSVSYSRITALLIEAVKEQQEQIDTLRQQNDAMLNEITKLKNG